MKITIDAWVARDESGSFFLSKQKPERQINHYWDSWDMDWVCLPQDAFPGLGITWNDEPKQCKISIEL